MKEVNKLSFGVQGVQAGQKSSTVNAAPQLIANSTNGKFVVTSAVSKALGVAVGEHIMFLNNIDGVEKAIQARVEAVVEFATENGFDLDTAEGEKAVREALIQWYIAKGVKEYDKKGNPILASERYTKEDKAKYLAANKMAIVEANRDALVEQFGEMSDEELAEKLTVDMVEAPKYHSCKGSKTATTSNATGVGCQLSFTDTAIWTALKKDIEDPTTVNRIFEVNLEEASTIKYSNGYEDVDVTIYPISFVSDEKPISRGKNNAE